jgi:hypothetical protein
MPRNTGTISGQRLIDAIKFPEHLPGTSLRDWDSILRLAKRANLIGRLAEGAHHQDVMDKLPVQARTHLESARVLTSHQRQAIAWETRHIGQALESIGAPLILLKGAAYAIADLTAARGRLFGDVDVLVPKASLNQAEAALMLHGWASGHADPYDERYYRRWMHELPPMAHRKRGTVIDVHHNILPLTARNFPSADLLVDASVPVSGTDFRVLSPCDMVIHSATHLFHEGELQNGLRDLFDLDALITEFSGRQPNFWTDLINRARLLDLAWPLHLAMRYTKSILGTEIPGDAIESVSNAAALGQFSQRLLDEMYLQALKPDHPLCSNYSTELARAALYLRSHYLRMPIGLLAIHLGRKSFLVIPQHHFNLILRTQESPAPAGAGFPGSCPECVRSRLKTGRRPVRR